MVGRKNEKYSIKVNLKYICNCLLMLPVKFLSSLLSLSRIIITTQATPAAANNNNNTNNNDDHNNNHNNNNNSDNKTLCNTLKN